MKYGVVLVKFFNSLPISFRAFSFSSSLAIWWVLMALLGGWGGGLWKPREVWGGGLWKAKEFWRATSATVIPGWCCPFVGVRGGGR